MGVLAGIDIDFSESVKALDLIDDLLDFGWSYNDNNEIVYLPLGDDGLFDWKSESLSNWSVVREIVSEKSKGKELIGLSLVHVKGQTGGEFLIDENNRTLMYVITINRKTLRDGRKTDFHWYEEQLISFFHKKGYKISSFQRSEID